MVRLWARRLLLVLAPLLLAVGAMSGVANREVLDGARFAAHANSVRQDPHVAELVGTAISQQILRYDQNLVALRPAIESVMVSLVRSSAFTPIVETAVEQLHEAFTRPGSGQVVLRLADLTAVVVAALKTVAPNAASRLPADLDVRLAGVGGQSFAGGVVHATRVVNRLAWLLPLLALIALAGAIGLSRRRQRALAQCGLAIAGAGALAAIGCAIVAITVSAADTDTLRGAITAATWKSFGPACWRAALVVAAGGLVLFAAAGAYLPRWSVAGIATRAAVWIQTPGAGARPQLISGLLLVVLGAAAILRPLETAQTVAVLIGLGLVTAGVSRISLLSAQGRANDRQHQDHRSGPGRWVAPAVSLVGVATLTAYLVVSALPQNRSLTAPSLTATSPTACNGHVELCSRPYDEVAYPATHNSMSAADQPGWFLPEQPTGLIGQLNAGIRVLLIDSWYGQPTNRGGVITNAAADQPTARAEANETYGASVVQSALRLRSAVGLTPKGPVEPYLCHALCELGSTPMLTAMQQVRQWMVAHPREVVTFIIEDNVTPADTAKVFRQAGLLPLVHTQLSGQPWPTLEQLIDAGQRLQVFAERRGGGTADPWLVKAFDWVQDTPYDNANQAALSCTRLRGGPGKSLLLINNIMTRFATRVSDSATINAFGTLAGYVNRCQAERGQLPNFIAVDYYNQGEVFSVVNELNGVS